MSFFCDAHFGFIRYFDHKNGKIALNRKYSWTHGLWGLKTMSNDNIKQFLIFHQLFAYSNKIEYTGFKKIDLFHIKC